MADYTPDTETVREQYTREQPAHIGTVAEKSAEFDRWLAQERATAQQAVRVELAALFTARAAQARSTRDQFLWQQAERTARGVDR